MTQIKNEDIEIGYFGTNLKTHGHYYWLIQKDKMQCTGLRHEALPFYPESLINNVPKGKSAFYQGGGYTVIAISGSPVDKRNGSATVFWIKQIVSNDVMMNIIINNQFANDILVMLKRNIDPNIIELLKHE